MIQLRIFRTSSPGGADWAIWDEVYERASHVAHLVTGGGIEGEESLIIYSLLSNTATTIQTRRTAKHYLPVLRQS